MLFNRQDILDAASRRIAPAPPATAGERAAIDAEVFGETMMSLSAQAAIDREYERYIADLEQEIGKRPPLVNPMRRRAVGGARTIEDAEAAFDADVAKLRETHPDIPIRNRQSIHADIASRRKVLRRVQAGIAAAVWT